MWNRLEEGEKWGGVDGSQGEGEHRQVWSFSFVDSDTASSYKPHSWLGTTGGLKGVEYRCQEDY